MSRTGFAPERIGGATQLSERDRQRQVHVRGRPGVAVDLHGLGTDQGAAHAEAFEDSVDPLSESETGIGHSGPVAGAGRRRIRDRSS